MFEKAKKATPVAKGEESEPKLADAVRIATCSGTSWAAIAGRKLRLASSLNAGLPIARESYQLPAGEVVAIGSGPSLVMANGDLPRLVERRMAVRDEHPRRGGLMSAIAGGVCCSGAPHSHRRHWVVDHERRLWITGPSWKEGLGQVIRDALRLPIPGKAEVLTCDPFRMLAVLSSGALWGLDTQSPMWRSWTKECDMPETKDDVPVFIAAGTGCGHVWVATEDRRLWMLGPSGRSQLLPTPVPGTERILAVDAANQTVILGSGERLSWTSGTWGRMPGFTNGKPGCVKVRVLSGITLTIGDVYPPDVVEVPEAEARPLIARRVLEVVPIGEES
jgi:hypothetical protein